MVSITKTCSIDSSRRDTSIAHGFIGRHEPGTSLNVSWSGTGERWGCWPGEEGRVCCKGSPLPLHETFKAVPGSCWSWNHAQSKYSSRSVDWACFGACFGAQNHPATTAKIPHLSTPYTIFDLPWSPATTDAIDDFSMCFQHFLNIKLSPSTYLDQSCRLAVFIATKHVMFTFKSPKIWKILVWWGKKVIKKKVIFDNFPESFETSNLAHWMQLGEHPIQCRCLFGKKVTGTPSKSRKTACTTAFSSKVVW